LLAHTVTIVDTRYIWNNDFVVQSLKYQKYDAAERHCRICKQFNYERPHSNTRVIIQVKFILIAEQPNFHSAGNKFLNFNFTTLYYDFKILKQLVMYRDAFKNRVLFYRDTLLLF